MTASAETSRRALLVGAAGGLAALVAQALGRPAPVHAEDEAIVVGGEYDTATSKTLIANSANNEAVFQGRSFGAGTGVYGQSGSGWGVSGYSETNTAVIGQTNTGIAVHGISTWNTGVNGFSDLNYGGVFDGGLAHLRLPPKATAGKPTSGAHQKGEIYMDSKSNLFVCSVAGTPGTWKKVLTKLV